MSRSCDLTFKRRHRLIYLNIGFYYNEVNVVCINFCFCLLHAENRSILQSVLSFQSQADTVGQLSSGTVS